MTEFKMVVEKFEAGQKILAEAIGHVSGKLSNLQEQVAVLTEGQSRLETGQNEIKAEIKRLVRVETFNKLVRRVKKMEHKAA